MTKFIFIGIALAFIIGYLLYLLAKDKGKKNPNNWFLAGFIGSLLALLIGVAIKSKNDEKK